MLDFLIFFDKLELVQYYNEHRDEIKLISIMNDTVLDKQRYILWFLENIENSELVQ